LNTTVLPALGKPTIPISISCVAYLVNSWLIVLGLMLWLSVTGLTR
jgi:hypothetical protein